MRKKLIIRSTVGVLLAALAAAAFFTLGNSTISAAVVTKRISSGEVRLSNLDAFEAQIRRDVPLGAPKQRIETYLSQQNIPHLFAEPNSGVGENTFYGTLKNIGARWGFPASLAIRIHLDHNEKVDKIWFRVDYDAP
jgi:hypothetical protein